ncbi:hypothetical protein GYMLUDRAFT_663275 [Collybiopsis luxurians FD-317 M1]|uniref:Uncharacterized protein n=1 Tax=Collybiopsis luxurians FD-317 M1 TaxID=944289 RepID=A0A0D0CMJ4_9AGAR|nr:hypothetical protein GYMLUDRAFT_663275 [Collybiopsis luxurians FD-317 M1]
MLFLFRTRLCRKDCNHRSQQFQVALNRFLSFHPTSPRFSHFSSSHLLLNHLFDYITRITPVYRTCTISTHICLIIYTIKDSIIYIHSCHIYSSTPSKYPSSFLHLLLPFPRLSTVSNSH